MPYLFHQHRVIVLFRKSGQTSPQESGSAPPEREEFRDMTESVVLPAEQQAPLEGVTTGEVVRVYQEVAEQPEGEFDFYHGRQAAELFGYERHWLDRAPPGAVASFAAVGGSHEAGRAQPAAT